MNSSIHYLFSATWDMKVVWIMVLMKVIFTCTLNNISNTISNSIDQYISGNLNTRYDKMRCTQIVEGTLQEKLRFVLFIIYIYILLWFSYLVSWHFSYVLNLYNMLHFYISTESFQWFQLLNLTEFILTNNFNSSKSIKLSAPCHIDWKQNKPKQTKTKQKSRQTNTQTNMQTVSEKVIQFGLNCYKKIKIAWSQKFRQHSTLLLAVCCFINDAIPLLESKDTPSLVIDGKIKLGNFCAILTT